VTANGTPRRWTLITTVTGSPFHPPSLVRISSRQFNVIGVGLVCLMNVNILSDAVPVVFITKQFAIDV